MNIVIHNSVSMRWIQPSEKKKDQDYANNVLDSFYDDNAVAVSPRIEATHAILNSVKYKNIRKFV